MKRCSRRTSHLSLFRSSTCTAHSHESTYSHSQPYYAASIPVLSNTSRRRVMITTKSLISPSSILIPIDYESTTGYIYH
jgi:hypothetical protein